MNKPLIQQVALGARSYDIVVGQGLLARAHEWIVPKLASKRVILVSDETVAGHYAEALKGNLTSHGIRVDVLTVPAGEGSKCFATLEKLLDRMLALTPDRKTTILALGGGVVGDLAGFAASVLLRGVPFIQIPTTLLSQVDSSVGGKTGINTSAGKNLVGSFYQPELVLADLDTLKTLPARELRAGYAEVIKYGLIMDTDFYRWCLTNASALLAGDVTAQQRAVIESCRMKAEIVGADERESGARALLNFGHTFAHALEAELAYDGRLLHGEAVGIGMVMACRLSNAMGLIAPNVEQELASHFKSLAMPAVPTDVKHAWNAEKIASHYAGDKKAEDGALTFVVLDEVGKARVAKGVNAALALKVTQSFLES